MKHRHLSYPRATPVERLPAAAIVDLLDRGDLETWRPIAVAIRAHPNGPFTEHVLALLDAYPTYGTSPMWRAWIERCRIRAECDRTSAEPIGLAMLRRKRGLTQAAAAVRLKMSQSDLSKFERRRDVRMSTLRAYAKALGGTIEPVFASADGRILLQIGSEPARSLSRPRRAKRSPHR